MIDLKELARQGYTISPEYLSGLDGDQEIEFYVQRLQTFAYRPGERVRLRQDLISQWIEEFSSKPQMAEYVSVLRAFQNVGDNKLSVEQVHVDAVGDILYTIEGSDLKVASTFCANALPFIHEYGVLALHEDRVWFVYIDDKTSEAKQVFEITQAPARAAQHQLGIDSLTSLAEMLRGEESQAIAGEFAVEDHGAETWGLLYTSWNSNAPEPAMRHALSAIEEAVDNAPTLN